MAAVEPRRPGQWTYDDYVRLPDDGRRHEVIDGAHYVSPSASVRHQVLSGRIEEAIRSYLRDNPLGDLLHAPLDVILSDADVVQPDILFVSNDRRAILRDWVRGAPDLVVEILSSTTRRIDEGVKRRLYDRAGVREYWMVDPDRDTVTIHRPALDGSFPCAANLTRHARVALSTPVLPGFELPLDALFAS